MKIYTKTGDAGETSLFGGRRVSKSNLRIDAYGTVDELNAFMGLLRDQKVNFQRGDELKTIQDRLFDIGSNLATDDRDPNYKVPSLVEDDVLVLEGAIDGMESQLTPLKNFILPGGHESVSFSHVARTVCRRAERCVVALNEVSHVDENIIQYLNRLSDYLFVLGRVMAKDLEVAEVIWTSRAKKI
ncbi:cob(I)yrinic acid a,c-diamide adenosyltransferase [Pleomorphovibrio marinus]|uniref:cob(I)yrinic acid a,c-diamide adenosyltransferase n=1 Tax=Pleomorphovibrio marinus TaxID=2164132 RepID=UPI000E0B7C0A|nr:cob(I)yrinic acid a,c-diamide adenosyltransferase [Pleomorphovibrio marinus]